ncbi:hypothetical protein NP493_2g08033 [Ridgeia piscesae]|uniref:G-protein coupled receptors family 1 profile domain-containing protein n=1 Tax=Ridgeia piscesae TaxID=27915 RepID=A0AAD9PG37_RIDPI|nr:hypothetical protein NP493_2g08033 [Ridgeia piscesae]
MPLHLPGYKIEIDQLPTHFRLKTRAIDDKCAREHSRRLSETDPRSWRYDGGLGVVSQAPGVACFIGAHGEHTEIYARRFRWRLDSASSTRLQPHPVRASPAVHLALSSLRSAATSEKRMTDRGQCAPTLTASIWTFAAHLDSAPVNSKPFGSISFYQRILVVVSAFCAPQSKRSPRVADGQSARGAWAEHGLLRLTETKQRRRHRPPMTSYVGRVLDAFITVVTDANRSAVMYFDDMNDTGPTGYNLTGNVTWGVFGETADRVAIPLLLSVIGAVALVGNAFVIYNVTSYKRMRTGPNLMLANIACADVVFVACAVPMAAVNHVTGGLALVQHAWLVHACKFVHYVMFVTIYVSVYTLVVACVFTYFGECVRLPDDDGHVVRLEYGAIFQEAFICEHTDDLLSSGDPVKLRTLWLTFLACAFLFPTLAICLLSALVLRRQLRYRRHRDTTCDDEKLSEIRRKRELIMVVMVSMIVRAVCWIPIQLFVLLYLFAEVDTSVFVYQLADLVGVTAVFIGACLNPVLYNFMSSELRQAFCETYRKSVCKCTEVKNDGEYSDMNETIMSIISDSSNHINYT